MSTRPITVLSGGVGAARFLQGVIDVVPATDVTAIGNVGDDLEIYGLHVSPDLDTVLYTLTGWIDEQKGWGVRGDSSRALDRARDLGAPAWFWLGDLDIGLHLARTERLRLGEPLSCDHRGSVRGPRPGRPTPAEHRRSAAHDGDDTGGGARLPDVLRRPPAPRHGHRSAL